MTTTCPRMRSVLRWIALLSTSLFVELAVAVEPSLAQIETAIIFVPTGSMNEARYLHAAALLESGEILVTGGVNQGGSGSSMTRYRASAELYDVPQKTFKLTDSMSIRRAFHTATTLSDGTVLIAGGISIKCMTCDGTVVAAAERYDPRRKKFLPTGSLIAAPAFHTATLLADGRVLIAGGRDLNNSLLSSAELFDPATGTLSSGADVQRTRLRPYGYAASRRTRADRRGL